MTTRELKICKDILDVLHEADGHQLAGLQLHGKVYERTPCSLPEFDAAFALVSKSGWVNGVENRITKKMKWNINDAGEAARLEM